MLRKILAGWKKDSLVHSAFEDTNTMLRKSLSLFLTVSDAYLKGEVVKYDIYAADKEINRLEIGVRRKVLEHLSINPQQDLISSLVLTTIISDIERIGDYTKNIFELSNIYKPIGDFPPYTETLREATKKVKKMFDHTIIAFKEEDQETAYNVMVMHGEVNRTCEDIILGFANDPDVSTSKVVSMVLYARYLKRVSAHLANVMSSVIKPFDRIGYFTEQNNESGDEKDID